jgi:hypothetical protein
VSDPARGLPGTQGEWVARPTPTGWPSPRTGDGRKLDKPNPFIDDRAVWLFTV